MNGKRREIPVTPPERELQRCYYSPSIFLTSSQTAPAPSVVLTLTQDGNPQRIALNLHDGKMGDCEQSTDTLVYIKILSSLK